MTTHITQTTHCFTLQQLRAATQAGGVAGVSLKGHGNGFFIQIQLRTGQQAVLVTARSRSPRMFKSPVQAFGVLRKVGIVTGSFDVTHYVPEQHQTENDTQTKNSTKKDETKVQPKTKEKTKTKAVKVPRAKKTGTTDSFSTPSTNKVNPIDKQDQLEHPKQKSISDPSIQLDETETKRLMDEQKKQSVGIQQSLI